MSTVLKSTAKPVATDIEVEIKRPAIFNYLHVIVPILMVIATVLARTQFGSGKFLDDGSLIVLALICYLGSTVLHGTNLVMREQYLTRLTVWVTAIGFYFNASAWGVRWIAAGDREGWIRWIWGYIPFANLYDLSLAFVMGAVLTTLVIEHKPNYRFVGTLSMPLASLILTLALFLGREFINLPPILDSYWRPIHVGIASLGYGVALVAFSLAVAYLLKDGVKIETMAIYVALFGVAVFAVINKFGVITSGSYGLGAQFRMDSHENPITTPMRIDIPYVGPMMVLALISLLAAAALFLMDYLQTDPKAKRLGHIVMRVSLALQVITIGALFYQMRALSNVKSLIDPARLPVLGEWLAKGNDQAATLSQPELVQWATNFSQSAQSVQVSAKSNPVEVAAIITVAAATLFIVLFALKPERILESMPPLKTLDSLIYKTVGVVFPLLTMLLITGAVWANESWGRYWGWDAKEVGALTAWMAYAGYIHTRIARGWSGRRSAYFALVGFLFIIFTYLGVSYLLPGLHSYA